MNININNIIDVDMKKLRFHLSDQLPADNEGNTLISLGQGILNIAYNEDEAIFKAHSQFVLVLSDKQVDINPRTLHQEDFFQFNQNYFLIEYNLFFDLENNVVKPEELIEDREFTKEIYTILEPYIRQSVNSIFGQSNLPGPILPYRYWKKFYAGT